MWTGSGVKLLVARILIVTDRAYETIRNQRGVRMDAASKAGAERESAKKCRYHPPGHKAEGGHPHAQSFLALTALGVVFGDIGTSPLYTFSTALTAAGQAPGPTQVLGVVSLTFWALMMLISLKYVTIVLRADNDGEGGILALLSLVEQHDQTAAAGKTFARGRARRDRCSASLRRRRHHAGDLSPVGDRGAEVQSRRRRTSSCRRRSSSWSDFLRFNIAGPAASAACSVRSWWSGSSPSAFSAPSISGHAPEILAALNPMAAVRFAIESPFTLFIVLGGVFLALTGGEALYADMGHVGSRAIRQAWFGLVFPALILSYFGQGARVLVDPKAIENPFYSQAPGWALIPMVLLATLATIIASQALISGVFSMTRQAIQMGLIAALQDRADVERRGRTGLSADRELAPDGRHLAGGGDFQEFRRAGFRLRDCRVGHHVVHDAAALSRRGRALELAAARRRAGHRLLRRDRGNFSGLQLAQDRPGRLVSAHRRRCDCDRDAVLAQRDRWK